MISKRASAEGNVQSSNDALKWAEVFFTKQDKERETLCDMYHDQSTLIWNGAPHKSKTAIAKFYQKQQPVETTLSCLDAQILPPMGDIVDMVTILAGGKLKQEGIISNFSRVFLVGPNAPGSTDYKIVSDNMRMYNQ